jgi:two-component sensor histidine kinase
MSAAPRPGPESLRTLYYVAAAVLAALVPLILFAGLWLRTELEESERELETYLMSRSDALSERLDAEINREISVLAAMATLPSLDEANLAYFHGEAQRITASMPPWADVAVVDPATGRQILSTTRPVGLDLPALPVPDAVRRLLDTGRTAIRTLAPGEAGAEGGRTVLIYFPVVRNGAASRALVAGVKREAVQQIVQRQGQDGRLLLSVVDEGGRILGRSRAPDAFVGGPANEPLRQATAGKPAGFFTAPTLDGQNVQAAFLRSPLTGWLAVAAADRSQFDALSARSAWTMVGTAALSLTLAGVLAVFLIYNVVQRRVSSERYAASRALGELDARLLTTTQQSLAEQRKAAAERDVLLREIYHRVKNNLQIIQSLLRLGSRDLAPAQREPFEGAVRRIGAMARVHNLLYKSPDLASIDFKEYLEDLVPEVAEAFGAEIRGVTTELEVQPIRVALDTAVPLAFITVELLTNAYRHAFPGRSGVVTVATEVVDGHGVLRVQDNGVGMAAERGPKRPLGLTIVRKLAQQIGGSIEEPEPGESTFRITFPLDPGAAASLPAEDARAELSPAS